MLEIAAIPMMPPVTGASPSFLGVNDPLADLPDRYGHFRNGVLSDFRGVQLYSDVVFIALDTEWAPDGNRNQILSYQSAVVAATAAVNVINYVPPRQRLRLMQIIERGVSAVHGGSIPANFAGRELPLLVVLIAHNTVAEWSALFDRDCGYITSRLRTIRKCAVTGIEPIEIRSELLGPVAVHVYDTMLLAPAEFKSLDRLSSLLGDTAARKLDIPERYKRDMRPFLRDEPRQFEAYALRDTEVTIKLFITLQEALNELALSKTPRLFKTLAAAAVKGFLRKNRWFKEYQKGLRQERFNDAYRLIVRSYHGGRNEGFVVGDSRDFNTPRTWADIDFSGCYPTALSLVPKIDVVGGILDRKATLVIDAETTSLLLHEGLTPNMIRELESALSTSNEAFLLKLFRLKNRRLAACVRQICERPDNSLIVDWLKRSRAGLVGNYLIPGFAKIRFSFPDEMPFPCLPVSHEKYGLVYPLSGETCVTAAEVVLAMEAGAQIDCLWAVELPVEVDDAGIPIPLLRGHIRDVMCARKEYADKAKEGDAAAGIYERLLKEFANSFYGKFAQAINVKSATDDTTGLSQKMPPSQITEPCVAALTTGFARAALSAALIAVDRFNQEGTCKNAS